MLFRYIDGQPKSTNVPLVVVLNSDLIGQLDHLPDTHNAELIKAHATALLEDGNLKDGGSADVAILDGKILTRVTFLLLSKTPNRKDLTTLAKSVGGAVKKLLGNALEVHVFDAVQHAEQVVNVSSYPSIVRGISNELYDYKDSLNSPEIKRVNLLHNRSHAETRDIELHNAMVFVRDLVTAPPNTIMPQTLVAEAKKLVGKKIKMIDHVPAQEQMAGLMAVGRGSSLDPEFIELHYKGRKSTDIDFVFIGKGITFDSGGYSLKPAKSMETMKGDMAGAATVLGLFKYLQEHGCEFNIVGLIPTCENMIGRDAIVPGEVIKYSNGKSVEVLNTDAEGRLILADALIYSQKFNAKVIDIATLTGGIVVALGSHRSGLFGTEQSLIDEIKAAGDAAADPVWEMPMDDEVYSPKSEVADMKNISSGPSSITAALFLREFAPKNWAHLDIAGTSGEAVGTGRPLPLIIELIK